MWSGTRTVVVALVLVVWPTALHPPITALAWQASPPDFATRQDNQELRRLHGEDQADRAREVTDWSVVAPRDRARWRRVKELFETDRIQTARDYYHAAMILQHGDRPDDYLLAHEFCVVAISKGKNDKETRWLAASSEDRFLMEIGRPQRFGTQFRSEGDGPLRLYTVGAGVTDELRRLMGVHSLAEAKAHEAELNKK